MKERIRKIYQKTAVVLTACMLVAGISPITGLAKVYHDAPIGGEAPADYNGTFPMMHIKVNVDTNHFETTVDDLKENNEFETNFTISVDFDDIASPGNASPSDWDPDAWADIIASELEFNPVFSEDTAATAKKLGATVSITENPYKLLIRVNNPQELLPNEGHMVTVLFNASFKNITYPGGLGSASTPGVTIIISDSSGSGEEDVCIPAKSPTWSNGKPGVVTWDSESLSEDVKERVKYTAVRIFRDGENICPGGMVSNSWYQKNHDVREFFTEPGEYTFQASFIMTRNWYVPEEYWSEESAPIDFTLPDKLVSIPQNLKWLPDGTATWDRVPEEAFITTNVNRRYVVYVYAKDDETSEFERLGRFNKTGSNQMDVSAQLEAGKTYKFRVMALGDLMEYANSELSDFSDEFVLDPVAQGGNDLINNLLNSDDVKTSVESTNLSDENKGTLKLAIQVYKNVAEKYGELESAYREEAGKDELLIETGASSIEAEKVTVIGGILNGATGIKFENPTPEDLNNANVSQYRNKAAVNITLSGEAEGELKYPVLITMPTPLGVDAEDVLIIHVKHDGSIERIRPRVNDDGTVSFAVTNFSTFFFVDSTSASGGYSGGSGGGGGSSFGASATGTVTMDARKGRINSLTGIITGSGEGYSKWISEVPQGQVEGTATRWKLQYADGTFATGFFVTDEQGNLVKDEAGNPVEQPLWELVNGAWYAFGADGYAKEGFVTDPALGGIFYIDINTGMKTGWQEIAGQWRYFNTGSDGIKGKMAVATTIGGYYINEDGVWVQ